MGQTYEARDLAAQGLKRCKDCKEVQPFENFKSLDKGRYRDSYCGPCTKTRDNAYRERDHESYKQKLRDRYAENQTEYRDRMRRSMYGAPLGTFDFLLDKQNGKCAICGNENGAKDGRSLALDHEHDSGVIRGLLCTPCNQGIGAFRENLDLLRAAMGYLCRPGYTIQELESLLPSRLVSDKTADELGL